MQWVILDKICTILVMIYHIWHHLLHGLDPSPHSKPQISGTGSVPVVRLRM